MARLDARRTALQGTVYSMVRAMTGIESGRHCRTCKDSVDPRDGFGMSEGVCAPCRTEAA